MILPSMCLLFQPAGFENRENTLVLKNSLLPVELLHVWIGSNILGDCVSFFVARKYLNRICNDSPLTVRKLMKSLLIILVVATLCCITVMIASNTCYARQIGAVPNWSAALWQYGFNTKVALAPFAIRSGGHECISLTGGMAIIACITYLPVAITVVLSVLMFFILFPLIWVASRLSGAFHHQLTSGQITKRDLTTYATACWGLIITITFYLFCAHTV